MIFTPSKPDGVEINPLPTEKQLGKTPVGRNFLEPI
jgi:hypothetical protein